MPASQAGAPSFDRLLAACAEWDERDATARLVARDATLWTGGDEGRWLDWLDLQPARAAGERAALLAEEAREDGLTRVILIGMGGSSLAPEVFARVFPGRPGGLALTVLDTLDPRRLREALQGADLARCLVIVASKSGSTLEPSLLKDLLAARLREALGAQEAARRLVAITDPASALEAEARAGGWRAIVPGVPGIGGRYSALSAFGIVPAALLGVDVPELVAHAEAMRARCLREPARENPGVGLGIALGMHAREGRDKLTLLPSPSLAPLGAWIEQLVAESTGKWGRGILPVDGEPASALAQPGDDRVFVTLGVRGEPLPADLDALRRSGHPVLACEIGAVAEIGALMYRWEIATAVAGALLGIHPFDQPDVEAAKVAARARLAGETSADVPERVVIARGDGIVAETDARRARELAARLPEAPSLADVLEAHAGRVRAPGWIGLLAWRCSEPAIAAALDALRERLGAGGRVATTLGVGPRFLHSTGQLHKGGPATGTYIQVIGPGGDDLEVPGRGVTFGGVLDAQAEGDFDVLAGRGRRVLLLRITDAARGAAALRAALPRA